MNMKVENKKQFEKFCEDGFVDGDTSEWLWKSIKPLLKNMAGNYVNVEIKKRGKIVEDGYFVIKIPIISA
jgi:hypothetical protein